MYLQITVLLVFTGAGGRTAYIIISCIVGNPIELYAGVLLFLTLIYLAFVSSDIYNMEQNSNDFTKERNNFIDSSISFSDQPVFLGSRVP